MLGASARAAASVRVTVNIDPQRVIACEGIYNFRDYGGYAVAGGGRVRTGILMRSGEHGDASDADLARVAALELAFVVDLRGEQERAGLPCRRPDGFAAEIILHDGETVDPAKAAVAATSSGATPIRSRPESADEARMLMQGIYTGMPFDPAIIHLYTRYFARLGQSDAPSLVHCVAGKDRTGLLVALFHHLVGVHVDDAMTDYLASNHMPGRHAWLQRVRMRYGALGILPPEAAFKAAMQVEPMYLEAAKAQIVDRLGSLDAYLDIVLSVGPDMREAIVERFVAA